MDRNHRLPYRYDIQGLRALAIVLVVLAHAGVPGFAGGFVGVDVFFVLSGYLITGLLVSEHRATGGIRYCRFLARRLRRLLPAMLFMLFAVLLAAPFLLSAYEYRMQTGSFSYAATWTSNFFLAFSEFDYFSALTAKDVFLHTWSLGIEEQFYIVWSWLIVTVFAVCAAIRRRERIHNALLLTMATVFAASFLLCGYWAEEAPLLGFYMAPARGWQFALGAAVWIVSNDRDSSAKPIEQTAAVMRGGPILGVTGIALVAAAALLFHSELAYPGFYALVPSLGAAAIIMAGSSGRANGIIRLLAQKPLVWLGDRSYSLYLWHWPLLVFGGVYGLTDDTAGILLLFGASLGFAMLSYRFVEQPVWKGRFSKATPQRTILVSAFAMVCAVGLSKGSAFRTSGALTLADSEAGYDPRMDAPAIYTAGFGCDTGHFSPEINPCTAGAVNATHTAVLLGDSIGAQWVSLLPEIYASPDWQTIVLTKSACAIVDEEYYYDKVGGNYDVCTIWRDAALDYLAELKPDIVFVGSAASYEFTESQWINGMERTLERLTAAADKVVLIPGTPALSFDGPSCLEQPYRFSFRLADSRRECEEAMAESDSERVAAYLELSSDEFRDVQLLNLNDLVCPGRRCAARRKDGLTVYRDQYHLTRSFVMSQVPEVRHRLHALGLDPEFPDRGSELASSR